MHAEVHATSPQQLQLQLLGRFRAIRAIRGSSVHKNNASEGERSASQLHGVELLVQYPKSS